MIWIVVAEELLLSTMLLNSEHFILVSFRLDDMLAIDKIDVSSTDPLLNCERLAIEILNIIIFITIGATVA